MSNNRRISASATNTSCEFQDQEDFQLASIGIGISVLVLAAIYLISLFLLTFYEAEKCKKNMNRLGEFQREFIFTPQLYSRASAVSGYEYYTPRHSTIGNIL